MSPALQAGSLQRGLRLFNLSPLFSYEGKLKIQKKKASIHITITDNHPLLTVAFCFHLIIQKYNACLL